MTVLIMFSPYIYRSFQTNGRDPMVVLPMQSTLIITNVVSSNPAHGEAHSMHFVIKFVSDLRQVGGFFRVLHQ